MNNMSNEFHPSLILIESFPPGNRLIDSFSEQFSFHHCPQEIKNHVKNLNDAILEVFLDLSLSIVCQS